jgi:hypothetical protein
MTCGSMAFSFSTVRQLGAATYTLSMSSDTVDNASAGNE